MTAHNAGAQPATPTEQLAALATVRLDWADTPDHVWRDSPYHVDGLHTEASAALDRSIGDAERSAGPSPIGLVLQGQKGVGKTHLLGLVRRQTHQVGGYFFLDDLTAGDAFWENTAESLRMGLARTDGSGESQLTSFLRRVCERGHVDAVATQRIVSGQGITTAEIEAFVAGLRTLDRQVAKTCADTARALVLSASLAPSASGLAEDYLDGGAEADEAGRRAWNIRSAPKPASTQVREITWLLALTGPIVIAVDQLDTLVARSHQLTQRIGDDNPEELLVAQIADGLMRLREVTHRTLTVLACLPGTWSQIRARATDTVPDRFREWLFVGRLTDPALARALVAKRLGVMYRAIHFTPPYPTWPVAESAFQGDWEECTVRELFKRVGAHMEACVRANEVVELTSLGSGQQQSTQPKSQQQPTKQPDRFAQLDKEFDELRSTADITRLLDQAAEDDLMPRLLSAGLRAWIIEVGDDDMEWVCSTPEAGNELHARLTRTIDEASDNEEYWAFRAIAAPHHLAVLSRLRKARTALGLRTGADNRHLIVLRNLPWAKGEKTKAELGRVNETGKALSFTESDLRTFWALDRMFAQGGADLHEWLVDRRPASRSALLSTVLPDVAAGARERRAGGDGSRPPPDDPITVGTAVDTGEPVRLELAALRKHAAVFAGSGSGKTVLLRRIVEECALRGVSAIVLDPNNDLARLGDPWPAPPAGWGSGDAALADAYLAGTDVVVWTPGRTTGRPLAFQPLPDFAGVLDDEDEFGAAVEVAVATLAPQVRLTGTTARANIGLAVLRQAVIHHARTGSRSLPGLVDVLADLPDGVSSLNDGHKIAADLAEALKAAMVNDPLLAGAGEPVDPGVLLTPAPGAHARVSVVSFVGLPAEEQRQNFVNQLQMELFAWMKRNPAGDRPLGALFVMDEAQTIAASGTMTASTRSTIVLASQARKYGLGLLFATQAPKGLHNQVVGNATTQFFGRLNSQAQIAAAVELARAKGSAVPDIAGLARGRFYVAGEAFGFREIATPLCLSYHPASPLRLEEVIDRARAGR